MGRSGNDEKNEEKQETQSQENAKNSLNFEPAGNRKKMPKILLTLNLQARV